MDQDKNSLTGEGKNVKKKNIKGNHSPPHTGRSMPSQSLNSSQLGSPTLLLLLQFLLESLMVLGMEHPSGQLGSAVPTLSLCNSLAQLQPSCCEGRVGKREHWQCKQQPKQYCVISTLLAINPKHSTGWAATKKVNSIPARLNTALNHSVFYFSLSIWVYNFLFHLG